MSNLIQNLRLKAFDPAESNIKQNLAVSSTAVQFATFNPKSEAVAWEIQDAAVFITFDGSTPSASNGFKYEAGRSGEWHISVAKAMKAIRQSTDAVIHAEAFTI